MSEVVAQGAAPAAAPSSPLPGEQQAAAAAKQPADKTPPAPEKPAEPAKRKVKVDGEELEVTDDELVKGYQLGKTATKRLQEASAKLEEAKKLQTQLAKPGQLDALRAAGWSDEQIEELSIQVLSQKQQALLEQERLKAMDPKERELLEAKKRLQEYEEKEKQKAEEQRQGQVKQAEQAITGAVIATMGELPEAYRQNEFLANRVLETWAVVLEHADEFKAKGVEVTPKWVAGEVLKELRAAARELAAHSKDEELDELIPPTVRARLAKKKQDEAEATAHPALVARPVVRTEEKKAEDRPRVTAAQLLRRVGGPRAG